MASANWAAEIERVARALPIPFIKFGRPLSACADTSVSRTVPWSFPCDPSPKHERILVRTVLVSHRVLAERTVTTQRGERLTSIQTRAVLTRLKSADDYAWRNNMSRVPGKQARSDLQVAFRHLGEKPRRPGMQEDGPQAGRRVPPECVPV